MKLTVLGCSGSVPGPDVPTSGYLLEADGFGLLVELGSGTLGRLQRHRDPFTVDAVLLSHLHLDHCADVASLITYREIHPSPPFDPTSRKLSVFAPSGIQERLIGIASASEADRAVTSLDAWCDFVSLEPGSLRIGPFDIQVAPMVHICECYGFRISHGGRTFVFSGDTVACDALVELAADADVLLADSAWRHVGNRAGNLHMSGHEVGEVARTARVRRLLLTHVLPWSDHAGVLDDARSVYDGPVTLVEQDAVYTI